MRPIERLSKIRGDYPATTAILLVLGLSGALAVHVLMYLHTWYRSVGADSAGAYLSWGAAAVALLAVQVSYPLLLLGGVIPTGDRKPLLISGAFATAFVIFFVGSLLSLEVGKKGAPAYANLAIVLTAGIAMYFFVWARLALDIRAKAGEHDTVRNSLRFLTKVESLWFVIAVLEVGLHHRRVLVAGNSEWLSNENVNEVVLATGALLSVVLIVGSAIPTVIHGRNLRGETPSDQPATRAWLDRLRALSIAFLEFSAPTLTALLLGWFGLHD